MKNKLNELVLPDLGDKDVALSFSGGVDSTTLIQALVLKYGSSRVHALSFDYGQRNRIELENAISTAKDLGVHHKIIKLDYLSELVKSQCALISDSDITPKTAEEAAGDPQLNTYVAFRNAQFAMITAAFAEANSCRYIASGIQKGDQFGYWDTTKKFTEALNGVLSLNRENTIEFIAPFVKLPKSEVIEVGFEINKITGKDIYRNAWSCYRGADEVDAKQCGTCTTCTEVINGYLLAGANDEYIKAKFDVSDSELSVFKDNL